MVITDGSWKRITVRKEHPFKTLTLSLPLSLSMLLSGLPMSPLSVVCELHVRSIKLPKLSVTWISIISSFFTFNGHSVCLC